MRTFRILFGHAIPWIVALITFKLTAGFAGIVKTVLVAGSFWAWSRRGFVFIPIGHKGAITFFGTRLGESLNEGGDWLPPPLGAIPVDVREKTIVLEPHSVMTADLVPVTLHVSIPYRVVDIDKFLSVSDFITMMERGIAVAGSFPDQVTKMMREWAMQFRGFEDPESPDDDARSIYKQRESLPTYLTGNGLIALARKRWGIELLLPIQLGDIDAPADLQQAMTKIQTEHAQRAGEKIEAAHILARAQEIVEKTKGKRRPEDRISLERAIEMVHNQLGIRTEVDVRGGKDFTQGQVGSQAMRDNANRGGGRRRRS